MPKKENVAFVKNKLSEEACEKPLDNDVLQPLETEENVIDEESNIISSGKYVNVDKSLSVNINTTCIIYDKIN